MVCATDSRHTKGRLNFGNLTIPYRVFFTYVDSHHSSTDQEAASDAAWTSVCKELQHFLASPLRLRSPPYSVGLHCAT